MIKLRTVIIGVCGMLLQTSIVCAAMFQWTGAQDAFWTNAANWTVDGAVATRCPGVVTTTGSTADYTALHADTDEAVFSGAFARNTLNLDGLFSIHAITITGADTPQVVFGAASKQRLPIAEKGLLTVDSTVSQAPLFPYGAFLGKGIKTAETQINTYTCTVTNDGAEPLHFNWCGSMKDSARSDWVSDNLRFLGTGGFSFDKTMAFSGTVQLVFGNKGLVYINAPISRLHNFYIAASSGGNFELGPKAVLTFSTTDEYTSFTSYKVGTSTISGSGQLKFATSLPTTSGASKYSMRWVLGEGAAVRITDCSLEGVTSKKIATTQGLMANVGNVISANATTLGTLELASDNAGLTGPVMVIADFTLAASKIGAPGEPSPIGSGSEIWLARTGKLAYTGVGETTSRNIILTNYYSSAERTCEGSLVQKGTGVWRVTSPISAYGAFGGVLTLENSGEVDAELVSVLPDVQNGAETTPMQLKKTGIGRWIISGANTFSGEVILEDGTLRLTENGTFGNSTCLITRGGTLEIDSPASGTRTVAFETVRFQGGLRLVFDPAKVTVKMMSHAGREPLFLTVNGEEALVEADGTVRAKKPHEYAYDPNKWNQYPERWFYCGTQVGGSTAEKAKANFISATNALIHAHAAGYKAVALRYLEHILYARSYESRKYLCNYIELCDQLGVDIIPLCWNIGWCGKLDANATEADYLENVEFVVQGNKAVVADSEHIFLTNPSLEESTAEGALAGNWTISDKTTVSVDGTVAHTGTHSLKYDVAQDKGVDKDGKSLNYARAFINVGDVKGGERLEIGAWFRTQNLANKKYIVISPYDKLPTDDSYHYMTSRAVSFVNQTDGEWEYHSIVLDIASPRKLRVYFQVPNNFTSVADAALWMDDAQIITLTHRREIVRREGVNFVVKNADTEVEYIEGVDYEPVPSIKSLSDDDSITAFTPELSLTLTPTSSIPNNAKLLVSYNPRVWQSHLDGNGGYCMSNPAMKREVEQCADWIYRRLNPRRWFPYVDEIRVGGSCEYCRTHYNSMAGVLSDYIKTEYNAIRKNQPNAEVIIWDDMVNPYHNAREKYELCVGSFTGVWDMIPKDIIIADWMRGSTTDENLVFRQSEEFFRTNGFRTICCTYYDATKWQEQMTNQVNIINTIPGELGIMYCSWKGVQENGYPHMQEIGDIVDDLAKPIFLTNEWTGVSSGAWSNAANWSPAMETRAVVHIPAGVTVTVEESDLIKLNKMREIIVDGTLVLNTSEAPATTITGTGSVRKMSDIAWEKLPPTMDDFDGYVLVANGTIEMRDTSEPKGPIIYKPDVGANKPVISYGQQYLQTPLQATGAVAGEFDIIWNDISKEQCLAGVASDAGLVMLAGIRRGHWVYAMSTDGSFVDTGIEVEANTHYKVKVILEPGRQEFWLNGACVAKTTIPKEIRFNSHFYLCALNHNGVAVQKSYVNILSAKLYNKSND